MSVTVERRARKTRGSGYFDAVRPQLSAMIDDGRIELDTSTALAHRDLPEVEPLVEAVEANYNDYRRERMRYLDSNAEQYGRLLMKADRAEKARSTFSFLWKAALICCIVTMIFTWSNSNSHIDAVTLTVWIVGELSIVLVPISLLAQAISKAMASRSSVKASRFVEEFEADASVHFMRFESEAHMLYDKIERVYLGTLSEQERQLALMRRELAEQSLERLRHEKEAARVHNQLQQESNRLQEENNRINEEILRKIRW